MLGVTLRRRSYDQQLVFAAASGDRHPHDLWLATGERAGLVKYDRIDFRAALERECMLEQDPAFGTEAGPDHDRGGGGEPERVRAGDHDHRDCEQQSVLDIAAHERPPDQERDRSRAEGDEDEPERGSVG
jgi:hypothetical protein